MKRNIYSGEVITVPEMAETLRARVADGSLAALCERFKVDLLVLHGSAVDDPQTAGDVDLAYLPAREANVDHLQFVEELARLVPGDHLDVMPLHRADPVAVYAALGLGEPLVERHPEVFAEQRIRAFGEYRDTQKFRDLALRLVGT